MASFGSLYEYVTSTGIVIPLRDYDSIVTKVKTAFTEIFGAEVDTSAQTAVGRMIEALSLLFIDVLGVNAQNANNFNPNQAIGIYLDGLGAIWGIARISGESDTDYRARIIASASYGMGYVRSIRKAVAAVENVGTVCVLENGEGDAKVVDGIQLPAHSVFVCVGGTGYDDDDVAEAIYRTKSAGCAYQDNAGHGTLVTRTVTDTETGSSTAVKFHRAVEKPIEVAVTVDGSDYTGDDIVAATKAAIKQYVDAHAINSTITSVGLVSAVAASGAGIICTAASITSGHVAEDPITVLPYQYFDLALNDITVTVA